MLVRHADWERALGDAVAAAWNRPFEWARWDCVCFVADVVIAITGSDPMADYRDAYHDEASAWAALSARDGNLRQACKRIFGRIIKPAFARRGDVVMLRGGMAVGVCVGAVAVFVSPDGDGLVTRPMTDCAWAFPIGWEAR